MFVLDGDCPPLMGTSHDGDQDGVDVALGGLGIVLRLTCGLRTSWGVMPWRPRTYWGTMAGPVRVSARWFDGSKRGCAWVRPEHRLNAGYEGLAHRHDPTAMDQRPRIPSTYLQAAGITGATRCEAVPGCEIRAQLFRLFRSPQGPGECNEQNYCHHL